MGSNCSFFGNFYPCRLWTLEGTLEFSHPPLHDFQPSIEFTFKYDFLLLMLYIQFGWLFFFFFSFSFFRIPNICFFFFKLLLALIATSFLNVNENFLWFFLCSIFFELLFKTEQKSVVIKCQHLIEYTGSNQILSNVWFLTMEENFFALVKAKKPNKKQKIILYQRMACSIFSLSKLTPHNSHRPILPIKL